MSWHRARGIELVDWSAAWAAWCVNGAERRSRTPPDSSAPEPEQRVDPQFAPIRERLVASLGRDKVTGWFRDAWVYSVSNGVLVLASPHKLAVAEWSSNLIERIGEAAVAAYPDLTSVDFKVALQRMAAA